VFTINLGSVQGKEALLTEMSKSLRFPAYFGYNWDALADSLRDMSWAGVRAPWILFLDSGGYFAESNPDDWPTLLDILEAAIEFWRGRGSPLYVIVACISGFPEWSLDNPVLGRGPR
jgi:RNAse (barnase) inhibitor barstar